METLKFFNISYFKTNNYEITHHAKLDKLIIMNRPEVYNEVGHNDYFVIIKKIEFLFKNLISLDLLPKEIESYLLEAQKNANFKLKNYSKFLKKSKNHKFLKII